MMVMVILMDKSNGKEGEGSQAKQKETVYTHTPLRRFR